MNSSLSTNTRSQGDAQLYLDVVDKLMTRCGKVIQVDLKVGKEKRDPADNEKKVGQNYTLKLNALSLGYLVIYQSITIFFITN